MKRSPAAAPPPPRASAATSESPRQRRSHAATSAGSSPKAAAAAPAPVSAPGRRLGDARTWRRSSDSRVARPGSCSAPACRATT
jgi:hypothetical protein